MTGDTQKKAVGVKSWETWLIAIFLIATGLGAGYPLGVWHVKNDAANAVSEIKRSYDDASAARLQTLNMCLANQSKAVGTAAEAAKVAGSAAEAAAKAADSAKGAVEAATQK